MKIGVSEAGNSLRARANPPWLPAGKLGAIFPAYQNSWVPSFPGVRPLTKLSGGHQISRTSGMLDTKRFPHLILTTLGTLFKGPSDQWGNRFREEESVCSGTQVSISSTLAMTPTRQRDERNLGSPSRRTEAAEIWRKMSPSNLPISSNSYATNVKII